MATSTTAVEHTPSPARAHRRLALPALTAGRLFWALVALNIADLVTTRAVLDRGGNERNPLLEPVVHGMWGAVALKAVGLVLVAALLNRCAGSPRARVFVGATVTWYAFVVVWNLTVLLRLH
jgi:hypothetical protein